MTGKKELRASLLRRRKAVYQKNGRKINQEITSRLLAHPFYRQAEKLFIYLSVRDEADTFAIIENALQCGKEVYVPVCNTDTHTMQCVQLADMSALVPGKYNIPEPKRPHRTAEKNSIGLCIVPGLAFDTDGFRMGYGGGYYDRFLGGYGGVSFGLCYDECMVPHLPREATDMHVDGIFTETGFLCVSKTPDSQQKI